MHLGEDLLGEGLLAVCQLVATRAGPSSVDRGVGIKHSQDIRLDGGTGGLDALDDGLSELLDVAPGRVEGNSNDGLGPVRVSSPSNHRSTGVQAGSAAYILFSGSQRR